MKKELKLGKMTQAEISEWFGLKPDTFRKASDKSRSKKLRILKAYADYHIDKRSIIIDKINIPVYSPALEIIDEKFDETWSDTGIDTCKRVNLDLCYHYSQIPAQVDESTSYNYVLKVKTRKYGRNSVDEFGEEGYCEYVWCKFGEKGELEILTEEQQKIISECAKEAYDSVNDKIALLVDAYKNGEISKEDMDMGIADEVNKNLDEKYADFISLVIDRLGFIPDKATQIHKGIFWNN